MLHIIGIVGVPGRYGGFETLADYLIESKRLIAKGVVVYCEAAVVAEIGRTYKGAVLEPINWKANGWQSMIYDAIGMLRAARAGADMLVLGAAAGFLLPAFRLAYPRSRIYTNMAGLEWKRSKWGSIAKIIIYIDEWASVRFSHKLIADNEGLVDYVKTRYGVDAEYIAYGGDQYLGGTHNDAVFDEWNLSDGQFDFAMARAQSDNNVEMILEAYTQSSHPLVFVSNWDSSEFGMSMRKKFRNSSNIYMIGPIYDVAKVKALQRRTRLYVHGHSAGGTNPVLVEAMWAGMPTLAYDVTFNRHTTENRAKYFSSTSELAALIDQYDPSWARNCGEELREIARRKYQWSDVRDKYVNLLIGQT
jgi:glycosyltransferase involved in cell wall biosynthesis